MLMHVFAVYDMKAEAYYPPMFQKTVGLALRIFKDMANNPDTTVGRFPTDYALFQIGTYEDTTGILTPLVHTALGKAVEYVDHEKMEVPLFNGEGEQMRAVSGREPEEGAK